MLDEITAGIARRAQRYVEVQSFLVSIGIFHIVQHSLVEELGRNTLLVLLLAEVA